jgi:hypothetical protein
MPDEQSSERPLSASIGEQLEGKRVLDEEISAEREAALAEAARTERHEADERAQVAKHLGPEGASPRGWRARRQAARERGRTLAWLREQAPLLALPVAVAGGLVLGLLAGPRKRGLPIAGLLVAGWLLWRRRAAAA